MSDRRHTDLRYEVGSRIPGTVYEVVSEIGRGGMGRVYEVEDTTVGKRYALKTLLVKRPVSERAEVIDRMRRESRTLVRVAHANIVDVITAGVTSDGQFYYVMELLTGKPLRKLLARKKRLESHLAVPIAIDVADALDRAHSEGVIHRDVKPDNIFIVFREDTSTNVKIVDFGVAGLLDDLLPGRESGRLMGTLKYASPEQQRGAKAEPSMDIWGLGVTLFEMVVGHLPFRAKSMQEYIRAVQSSQPADRISEFLPEVVPELDALCARLLEKNPARRIPSMVLVASELRTVQRILQERRHPMEEDYRTEETLGGAVAFSFASTADGRSAIEHDARASGRPTPALAAGTLVGIGPLGGPPAPTALASATPTPDPPDDWLAAHPDHAPAHGAIAGALALNPPAGVPNASNESDTRFLDVGSRESGSGERAVVASLSSEERDREFVGRAVPTPDLPVVIAEEREPASEPAQVMRRQARAGTILPVAVFSVVVAIGGAGALLLVRSSDSASSRKSDSPIALPPTGQAPRADETSRQDVEPATSAAEHPTTADSPTLPATNDPSALSDASSVRAVAPRPVRAPAPRMKPAGSAEPEDPLDKMLVR